MAKLQKSIIYEGGGIPPLPISLVFNFPVFEYIENNTTKEGKPEEIYYLRKKQGERPVTITLSGSQGYEVEGISENIAAIVKSFSYFISFSNTYPNLTTSPLLNIVTYEDLSFKMEIDILVSGHIIGKEIIEVIELPLGFEIDKMEDLSIMYINKSAFSDFVDLLNIGGFGNFLLVILWSGIVKMQFKVNDIFDKNKFFSIITTNGETNLRSLYYLINKENSDNHPITTKSLLEIENLITNFNFDSLFDFPITIPKIESTKPIGGTFTIDTNEQNVKVKDLTFYKLNLEYFNGNSVKTIPFAWDLSDPKKEIGNEPIDFSFDIDEAIIGSFKVAVYGVNGGVLWLKEYSVSDQSVTTITIRVPLVRPNFINRTGTDGNVKSSKKIRGQVISKSPDQTVKNLTILIQGKKQGDSLWRILGASQTDGSGNFAVNYPYGAFVEAQAIVSLLPNSPTSIGIKPNSSSDETISDDFLYLLIDTQPIASNKDKNEENCDCETPRRAKRLPDQTDLIESDEYTQDVGGVCVNLTTPNRTLREYEYQAIVRTSDPDVANYTLEKSKDGMFSLRKATGIVPKGKENIINLDNPIRWQDAPDSHNNLSLYQAVTVATGHLLHYKSVFKADGYSMGDLLYSLPLAPGQKKQIVVFDSSHSLTGAESQTISQGESLSASLVNDRSITDQLSGMIGEALAGSSNANTSGISAGLGGGGSMGPISAVIGVSGGASNSNSSANQNSSRNVSQFFAERLRQSIMQNAESYRQLNASVVTTVREDQQYAVTTEVVANHNHCHALTMMYFEVLRHYAIYQELSHVEECVFVPLLMTNFTIDNIYKWKDVLAFNLLPMPSNTYLQPYNFLLKGRQHPLVRAFDANERIKTRYARVDFPDARFADDTIRYVKGEFTLRVKLERPKNRYDRILSFPKTTRTTESREFDPVETAKAWFNPFDWNKTKYRVTRETLTENARIFDSFMRLEPDFQSKRPAECIRVFNFNPIPITTTNESNETINISVSGEDFFEGDIIDKNLWTAYSEILGHPNIYSMLDNYFKGALISEWDSIFNNQILPEVFERIVESLTIEQINWDLNNVSDYMGGEKTIRIRINNGTCNSIRSALPSSLIISTNSNAVKKLRGGFARLDIEHISMNYITDHFEGVLYSGYKGDDLIQKGVTLRIPPTNPILPIFPILSIRFIPQVSRKAVTNV